MRIGLDSELIQSGRHGDRRALSELFEPHYPSSIRIARRILGHPELPPDEFLMRPDVTPALPSVDVYWQ